MFSSAVLDLLILIHFILFLSLKATIQPLAFWMYLTLTSYDLKKKKWHPHPSQRGQSWTTLPSLDIETEQMRLALCPEG